MKSREQDNQLKSSIDASVAFNISFSHFNTINKIGIFAEQFLTS